LTYRHYLFEPDRISAAVSDTGELSDRDVYVFDDQRVVLAVNVALVTNRPLLVYGPPGSGKSSLAPNIARELGWKYGEHIITARTEAEDLLWQFDAVKRLSDANTPGGAQPVGDYYDRGVLWNAFADGVTVVLIDEIDKADPDLPNALLGPLGSYTFRGPDGVDVTAPTDAKPLIVITTNDERDLPRPFLRRCVVLVLDQPSRAHLLSVAQAHFGADYNSEIAEAIADYVISRRDVVDDTRATEPSTAEFLDTLRACQRLEITPISPEWRQLAQVTLFKSAQRERTE
jgi:MoxR-like ATPase